MHGLALVGDLVLVSMVSGDVAVFACAAAAGGKLEEVRTICGTKPEGGVKALAVAPAVRQAMSGPS